MAKPSRKSRFLGAGNYTVPSDLNKHEETSGHVGIDLGNMLLVSQNLNTKATMKKFIEDFN